MSAGLWMALPLVFGSGFCALIYQVVWTRELRFVFGASTAASSAVIAIFIAGLGFGGLWFGRRVERSPAALRYYAVLEGGVALLSASTPWLLSLARWLYLGSGGSLALGASGSTLVRLLLATLVLGPATFLMGGTLPAIARAAETEHDVARRRVAVLYGVNTLGAVLGCTLATFVLLERLGSRNTLYVAAVLNLIIAGMAWLGSRRLQATPQPSAAGHLSESERDNVAPTWLVCASAAVVGFAFFLMEVVWYRVLGPLLGGTIFTFGLILAVALFGIGVGGALYAALFARRRAMLLGFALSCVLEAACIAVPYAIGDRIAVWAVLLRPLSALGFDGLLFGWALITCVVVLPAALIAGFQFPLLIALLGSGRERVARDVGVAYAANTLGAILGALAGGFGLLPAIGAVGAWRGVCFLLTGWGAFVAAKTLLSGRLAPDGREPSDNNQSPRRSSWLQAGSVAAVCVLTLILLGEQGPTAAWRHSPIGAGRIPPQSFDAPNTIESFMRQQRRGVDWQTDGIESSIGIDSTDGVGFLVNGKSDGNSRTDGPTQVMGGLLGAALSQRVDKAMVIGLGTGSTAGWLAKLPEIQRVDVAEIEPAILTVAKRCELVNERALDNPKLHVHLGDARELLAVSREQYDVIFSEPSNPYRAGVASLYTREFYAAVQKRLSERGLFVQWLQAYDIDSDSIRSVYATLGTVFPHVETWYGLKHDLLLVASRHAPMHDTARLRERLASEPFARALRAVWMTDGLEGFLGHYLANTTFAREAASGAPINTDDRLLIEFGFARGLRGTGFSAEGLLANARGHGQNRPPLSGPGVDWQVVDFEREAFSFMTGVQPDVTVLAPLDRNRLELLGKWANQDFRDALMIWNFLGSQAGHLQPILIERRALAELMAYEGDDNAESWIGMLSQDQPVLERALRAIWFSRHNQHQQASDALIQALHLYRTDPWPLPSQVIRALGIMRLTEVTGRGFVPSWLDALSIPFASYVNETARQRTRITLAMALGPSDPTCIAVFADQEPNIDWNETTLDFRAECYKTHGHPLREQAERDLAQWRAAAPIPFARLLR
ncbi:MAG TPA: fused MFS/spermidine synthase [Polyangiales bacterium]|nr:fused MFS/spermidine synthase [Polyangiales bacterium]